jgi:hypothetical protein
VVDIITPVDVFWLMLAARYGKAKLKFAEQITAYDWLLFPKSSHVKVQKGKVTKQAKIPLSVYVAAQRTLKLLRDHVREGDIGLRGELNNNPPIDINREDQKIGKLDIFQQTLTTYRGRARVRVYRNVSCVKDGVMRIVNSLLKNRSATTPITLEEAPDATIHVTAAKSRRRRSRPRRGSAEEAIQAIWPDGIPAHMENGPICKDVGEWLKAKNRPAMNDSTILRAAGRKN